MEKINNKIINSKLKEGTIFKEEREVYQYLSNINKRTYNIYIIKDYENNKMRNKNNVWFEELKQEDIDNNKFYTDVKYTYLFIKEESIEKVKKPNEIKNEKSNKYRFLGIFKLIDYDKKNIIRIWEKQK